MNYFRQGHQVVVAIDFGTSRSGYAYSFSEKEAPTECINWPDQPYEYPKTLTQVLYDPHGAMDSWGYTARSKIAHLPKDEAGKYDLISNFKMNLYKQKKPQTPAAHRTYETVNIIADFLRELSRKALEDINRRTANLVSEQEILWCLTVPAIWTELEKNMMRVAAQKAGLISDKAHDQERLKLVLEPEAAALYCMRYANVPMPRGTRFMVVDCGGGTVDITSSEIEADGKLREIAKGGGGPFGSSYVDQEFFGFLNKKLNQAVFDGYTREEPTDVLHLFEAWERIKCNFDAKQPTTYFNLSLKLHKRLEEQAPAVLEALFQEQGDDSAIHIGCDTMLSLFQPALKGIVEAMEKQFAEVAPRKYDYVFLAGGFATSPVLQEHLQQRFASRVRAFVTPKSPGAAIVTGAVMYGWREPFVSRIARQTVGCNTCMDFRKGIDPEAKKFVAKTNNHVYCSDRFSVFVNEGREVGVDEAVTGTYYPIEDDQTSAGFSFYATSNLDPVYVDESGVEKLGNLSVTVPRARGSASRPIIVSMYFGQTEIKVKAVDKTTGQEHETVLKYDWSR